MVPVDVGERIQIPGGIVDLEAFRRWARSDEFPEQGRFAFLGDRLWMDLEMEQLFTHNRVKTRIYGVMDRLAELGYFFSDGAFLTNKEAELSTVPDGVFASFDSVRSGRVVFEEGANGPIELIGSPDMVLEVVSKYSVRKDTRILRELYWLAEVSEYWLIDARDATLKFDILKRTARCYSATRSQEGWLKSRVFARSFRLTAFVDDLGRPDFRLEVSE